MLSQPYAQSLRVIGQALETLQINAFALKTASDKFIVQDWELSILKNIADEVWSGAGSAQTSFTDAKASDLLVYDGSDTERLEDIGRRRRGLNGEGCGIASGLRVVGDYLDKQKAVAFTIQWSTALVTVKYKTAAGSLKEANFTLQNLQDFGRGMYLRRWSRNK